MLLASERNPTAFGPWQPAATLASAVVALGIVIGWPTQPAEAVPASPDQKVATERCARGDDVSNFVCRNTWMAGLKRTYR